jgi:hypothetical protein
MSHLRAWHRPPLYPCSPQRSLRLCRFRIMNNNSVFRGNKAVSDWLGRSCLPTASEIETVGSATWALRIGLTSGSKSHVTRVRQSDLDRSMPSDMVADKGLCQIWPWCRSCQTTAETPHLLSGGQDHVGASAGQTRKR